jgi:phage tail-like protein
MAGTVTVTSGFMLEIDKVQIASFKSVSGLKNEIEAIEYKSSTAQGKLEIKYHPGASKWGDVTLERNYDGTSNLYDWFYNLTQNFNPDTDKVTGAIYANDKNNTETMRWEFEGAWPSVYEGPELSVDKNEVATEKVTIKIEGLKKVK